MSGVTFVGPSFRFMSGMPVYTCRLANHMAEEQPTSVILIDHLIPARFYPGGTRVGQDLSGLKYDDRVRILGRVDWWWRGLISAARALWRERPRLLVLQWWTAATLHTYLALAVLARLRRIPVAIEFHEVQDTGEVKVPLVRTYARLALPWLVGLATGAVVRHDADRALLHEVYGERALAHLEVRTAPHGPYDHFAVEAVPNLDDPVTHLLSFGTIRPYKGVEDLVTVFNRLPDEVAATFDLAVVGETWEGWDRPRQLIEASPHRDRIRFVNHYVTDEEAAGWFAAADVMVLPARRGSASGPLQMAMSAGLNVVMYAVEGLVEAVTEYDGVLLVPPGDLDALEQALLDVRARRHDRHEDPHSWERTVAIYTELADTLRRD